MPGSPISGSSTARARRSAAFASSPTTRTRSAARRGAPVPAGRLPVEEPGLEAAYHSQRSRFTFSGDPAVLSQADVVFISADVPTDDAGRSELGRPRQLL